jgi:hypothetical protein
MRAPSFPQRACPREALGRESSLRTRPLTLDPRLRRGDVVRGSGAVLGERGAGVTRSIPVHRSPVQVRT